MARTPDPWKTDLAATLSVAPMHAAAPMAALWWHHAHPSGPAAWPVAIAVGIVVAVVVRSTERFWRPPLRRAWLWVVVTWTDHPEDDRPQEGA